MEEERGFCGVVWMVFEDGDVAVWVLAVDEAGAWRSLDAEALGADGDAAIGADEDGGAQAPDAGPPWAEGPEPAEGQRGAGRRAERFSFAALCQAASGVMRSSRWRSWALRWVRSFSSRELAAGRSVMASAAKRAGRRFCQS